MIDGVEVKKLRLIADERGFLMEILRNDEPLFDTFGQVYLSVADPGVVKGWHYHKIQSDRMTVLRGMAKIVLYDMRPDSPTHGEVMELFVGERQPALVRVPPLVCHGVKCISAEPAYMINVPTHVYDYEEPDEYRLPPHGDDVPYDWSRKDG